MAIDKIRSLKEDAEEVNLLPVCEHHAQSVRRLRIDVEEITSFKRQVAVALRRLSDQFRLDDGEFPFVVPSVSTVEEVVS